MCDKQEYAHMKSGLMAKFKVNGTVERTDYESERQVIKYEEKDVKRYEEEDAHDNDIRF